MTVATDQDDSVLNQAEEQEEKARQAEAQTSDDDLDPDDAELIAARKAVEDEEAAAAAGEGKDGEDEGDPDSDAEGADAEGKTDSKGEGADGGESESGKDKGKRQQDVPMIPKPRFDEVYTELDQARQKIAYLEGQNEALRVKGPAEQSDGAEGAEGDGKADPQADDFQTRIDAARGRLNEAAKKYDAGEIGMADYEAERGKVDDEIYTIRSEMDAAQKSRNQQPEQKPYSDQMLEEQHLAQLDAQHPSLQHCTDADLDALEQMARAEFARIGKPIGTGLAETIRLRNGVARLADFHVPRWHPEAKEALQKAASSRKQSPGARQPRRGQGKNRQQLSPAAQARLEKLQDSQNEPPDTRNMGRGSGAKNEITQADINGMSDDEIAALPAETRARFLG